MIDKDPTGGEKIDWVLENGKWTMLDLESSALTGEENPVGGSLGRGPLYTSRFFLPTVLPRKATIIMRLKKSQADSSKRRPERQSTMAALRNNFAGGGKDRS